MRPCWLPEPGTNERCVLRCTRQGEGRFEIASWRGVRASIESNFTTHFRAILENSTHCATRITKMSISRYVSWDPITKVMDLQNLSNDRGMLNSHGKATAMRMPHHGCTAWIFNARKSLSSIGWRGALHRRTGLANVAFNETKRTLFHPERRQSCKSLRGTVLSRSRWRAAHASVNK